MTVKKPYELKGDELDAYRAGFNDGNESNYFPGGIGEKLEAAYDRGYRDGKKYGPRKGKPFTLPELLNEIKKLP